MDAGVPRSVTVYGVGLIGGSLALALRKRIPGIRIHGVDKPEILERAEGLGMLDPGSIAKPDLIVLATPVSQIALST